MNNKLNKVSGNKIVKLTKKYSTLKTYSVKERLDLSYQLPTPIFLI